MIKRKQDLIQLIKTRTKSFNFIRDMIIFFKNYYYKNYYNFFYKLMNKSLNKNKVLHEQ